MIRNRHPFSFWPKLSEKIFGILKVVGLFGPLQSQGEGQGYPMHE